MVGEGLDAPVADEVLLLVVDEGVVDELVAFDIALDDVPVAITVVLNAVAEPLTSGAPRAKVEAIVETPSAFSSSCNCSAAVLLKSGLENFAIQRFILVSL